MTNSKYDPSKTYWLSDVPKLDDFGQPITDEFIDAATVHGPWAMMSPVSWNMFGKSVKLGTGLGQRYKKQANGTWMKVEG